MNPKKNKTKILAVTLLLFLLSEVACSVEWIVNKLIEVPQKVIEYVVKEILITSIEMFIGFLKEMILWNPNPDDIRPMVDDFINLLIPVYVMIITILGIYIIFLSISPSGRAKAKSMFLKVLLSMILVSISLEIFKILLGISEALASRMLAGVVTTQIPQLIGLQQMNIISLFFLLWALEQTLIWALFVIALRYVLVLLLCAMFPFTLFLYFFEFTKDIGARLLRYTVIAIYTQVIQALMLSITVISINSVGMSGSTFSENILYGLLITAGALLIVLAPLIMLGIMKWIGGALAGIGMVVSFVNPAIGSVMVAAGGVAAGMGPGGLIAGGTAYGLGTAYRRAAVPKEKPPEKPKEDPRPLTKKLFDPAGPYKSRTK